MRVKQGAKSSSILPVFGGFFVVFLYIFSALLFPAASGNAKEAGAEVGVTVKEFIKLAVDTTNLALRDSNNNTSPVPTAAGAMLTGDLNIAVSTNTTKGYSLSAYTADNSTSMSNSRTGATTKINSIASISGYDATTGASDLSANTWGFQKYVSGAYTNWFGVGSNSENGTIIASTNSDDADFCENLSYPLADTGCSNGSYDTYTVKFGAKLTNTLPAGTYTNNVIFSAVAKSEGTKYTVNFNANSAEATGNTSPRTILEGSTITFPTATFSRENYKVSGWALTSSATTPTYTAGQTIAVNTLISAATSAGQSPATNNQITLYAVWRTVTTLDQITYMQQITQYTCEDSTDGATFTLRDSRDNQEYTVYKIPSNATYSGTSTVANIAGKCIMTKDLNVGAVASVAGSSSQITVNGTMTLSPGDSNFTPPAGTDHEGITIPTSSVNVLYGQGGWDTSNNNYDNKQYTAGGTDNYAGRGYYSWGAAMVACPKGWRLPIANEYDNSASYEGQTAGLAAIVKGSDAATTITNITGNPYFFTFGGYYDGSFRGANSTKYYWSATQYSTTASYAMSMSSSSGLSRLSRNKYYGFSVRCISN